MSWDGASEKCQCATQSIYDRRQFSERNGSLVGREVKIFARGQCFSTDIPNVFSQGVPGDLLLSCYTVFPLIQGDWIKKPVIWGLECRQKGAMVLNVVSGLGTLAGDGSMF